MMHGLEVFPEGGRRCWLSQRCPLLFAALAVCRFARAGAQLVGVVAGTDLSAQASQRISLEALPLRTEGRYVVNAMGKRLQLACVNWYGAQQPQMVVNGLNQQPLGQIAASIATLGFNCVRLPFSLEMVLNGTAEVPNATETLQANPALIGMSPLEVFDAVVQAVTSEHVLVFLNQHVSAAGFCCSNSDGEGFWYTQDYPEEAWLQGLSSMARRYSNNPRVAGFDLRNEVRPSWPDIPAWGSGGRRLDWSQAAVRGAKEVLTESPDMLIMISGIMFGTRLVDVLDTPIHSTVPRLRNRTLYSVHYYYGWNFDLVMLDYFIRAHFVFALLVLWLWGLLLADGHMGRHGNKLHWAYNATANRSTEEEFSRELADCHQETEDDSEESSGCPDSSAGLCWEHWVAIGFFTLFWLCVAIGKRLELMCGHIYIISPPFFAVVAHYAAMLFFLAVARILLAYTLVLTLWHHVGEIDSYVKPGSAKLVSRRRVTMVQLCGDVVLRCCGAEASRRLAAPLRHYHQRVFFILPVVVAVCAGLLERHLGAYESFVQDLDVCFGFLLRGEGVTPAPIWLSEFGTFDLDLYWHHLTRMLRETKLDFAYWSLNGEKWPGHSETYGLLNEDSRTVRQPELLQMLQSTIVGLSHDSR